MILFFAINFLHLKMARLCRLHTLSSIPIQPFSLIARDLSSSSYFTNFTTDKASLRGAALCLLKETFESADFELFYANQKQFEAALLHVSKLVTTLFPFLTSIETQLMPHFLFRQMTPFWAKKRRSSPSYPTPASPPLIVSFPSCLGLNATN